MISAITVFWGESDISPTTYNVGEENTIDVDNKVRGTLQSIEVDVTNPHTDIIRLIYTSEQFSGSRVIVIRLYNGIKFMTSEVVVVK